MDSLIEVQLPEDYNGVAEIGIAAGIDDLDIPRFQLKILNIYVPIVKAPPALEAVKAKFDQDKTKGKQTIDSSVFTEEVLAFLQVSSRKQIEPDAVVYKDTNLETKISVRGTLLAHQCKFTHKNTTAAYVQMLSYLLQSGMIPAPPGNRNVTHLYGDEAQRFYTAARTEADAGSQTYLTSEEIDAILANPRPAAKVATLIVATKVSWWLTNHHVGQDSRSIQSFSGKVVRTDEALVDGEMAEIRNILWAIGKYTVTIPVLQALGIPGLLKPGDDAYPDREVPYKKLTFTGTDDVRLRTKARPAGTADPCSYLAIARQAAKSMFSVLLPAIAELEDAKQMEAEILKNPARYHMGSKFLTGFERDESPKTVLAEETKENLSAFIHATSPRGNLAKAEVIKPRSEVEGSTIYMLIMNVRSEVGGMATNAFLRKLMAKAVPGIDKGGLAKQVGLISDSALTEAAKEVERDEIAEEASSSRPTRPRVTDV